MASWRVFASIWSLPKAAILSAACLNIAFTEREVIEGLIGYAKSVQGSCQSYCDVPSALQARSASLVQVSNKLARSKICKTATCLQPCDDRFDMSTKLVK